eukprot:COSAG02_NODE_5422_length_4345_cov_3.380593_1_plen_131_part_00
MRAPGAAASSKEKGKIRSYRGAMRRQEEGGRGWLVSGKCRSPDLFVPFGFEVGGALGKKAEWLMRECRRVAEWKNRGVGELTHWSAMTWGEHVASNDSGGEHLQLLSSLRGSGGGTGRLFTTAGRLERYF